jgi:hypothetical protein
MVRLGTAAALLVTGAVAASPSIPSASATGKVNATIGSYAAQLSAPIVGVSATPTGQGYWRVAANGAILTAGDAHYYGSAAGKWHDTVVAMASTPSGHGYWIVDRRGIVYAFGDAPFRGDLRRRTLNKPIVGVASTPNGQGYWMVATDGGIFTFGNAPYKGSMGGHPLNKPVVGMASTSNGMGYWLVASDGGMFTFNAPFKGSMGGHPLNKPIIGMAPAPGGQGYALVGADGGLFRFGSNVPFYGSAANACPGAWAVGVAISPGAIGYWITFANALTYAFSPGTKSPVCGPTGDSKVAQIQRDFLARTNQERAARGLPALQWDPTLANYAGNWSNNMAVNGFRHSNIGALLGPYNFIGENIAKGSVNMHVGALHGALMRSQGHRDNILAPGFTKIGIGVTCVAGDAVYVTEDFGRLTSQGGFPTKSWPQDPIVRGDEGTLTC